MESKRSLPAMTVSDDQLIARCHQAAGEQKLLRIGDGMLGIDAERHDQRQGMLQLSVRRRALSSVGVMAKMGASAGRSWLK